MVKVGKSKHKQGQNSYSKASAATAYEIRSVAIRELFVPQREGPWPQKGQERQHKHEIQMC